MRKAAIALVLIVVLLPMCTGVPLTAPSGSSLTLIANPTFVPANGGVSVVTAIVIEPAGTPVPNGTVVFFFTDLGSVDSQAKTKDGIARVNFVSDSRSGQATVVGSSGGVAEGPAPTSSTTMARSSRLSFGMPVAHAQAGGTNSDTVTIDIGSALPSLVIVTANPARITSPRHAQITANVFDPQGNPVANVPVIFRIDSVTGGGGPLPAPSPSPTPTPAPTGVLEETLDSGSVPVFTDTNGQAFDFLRTRSATSSAQKTVTVSAITPNGTSSTIEVRVN